MRPEISTLPEHIRHYISQIEENNIVEAYRLHSEKNLQFYNGISEQQSRYKYAENKWTVKEVLQHVIDTERVYCYRTLAFARGDKASLPGFDENLYAQNSHANDRSWDSLVQEYRSLCHSTMDMINSFKTDDYNKTGVAGGHPISVLAMMFTMVGHANHHVNMIKERYLQKDH